MCVCVCVLLHDDEEEVKKIKSKLIHGENKKLVYDNHHHIEKYKIRQHNFAVGINTFVLLQFRFLLLHVVSSRVAFRSGCEKKD